MILKISELSRKQRKFPKAKKIRPSEKYSDFRHCPDNSKLSLKQFSFIRNREHEYRCEYCTHFHTLTTGRKN
jgi:predicted RNA-binding Zn-ribbon protein involved in translation (DUF1610 family)